MWNAGRSARPRAVLRAIAVVCAITVAPLIGPTSANAAVGDITEISLLGGSSPSGIATGPDGNIWVASGASNTIARVSPSGSIAAFNIPTLGSAPYDIAAGPDGAMWFTERQGNRIGRITVDGVITEYPIPTALSQPYGIAAGPDGAMWFTERQGNRIGRITMAGVITEYPLPTPGSHPIGIAAGASNMYVTEYTANRIAVVQMSGAISEIPLAAGSLPIGIGNIGGTMWFTTLQTSRIGRIINDVAVTEISLAAGSQPFDVVAGPSGEMWVALFGTNRVAQLSSGGSLESVYQLPTASSRPAALVTGSDGNIWVAQYAAESIARIVSGQVPLSIGAPSIAPSTGLVPGSVATATKGTWSILPTSYSYQWQRCSATDPVACTDIAGATLPTYTLTAADALTRLRMGVVAMSLSGPSAVAYSGLATVGSLTAPSPGVIAAAGPIVAIGNGAQAELIAPSSQRRGRRATYRVDLTALDAPGTVSIEFRRASRVKKVSGLLLVNGETSYRWKVPRTWPRGWTTVTATFLPTPGTSYLAGAMTDRVRIR